MQKSAQRKKEKGSTYGLRCHKKFKQLFLSDKNYIYFFLIVVNVLFTIFIAKKNSINYATVFGKNILITEKTYAFLGRNYINLFIILFFSFYTILLKKVLMKKKITWKFVVFLFLFYFILDVLLFYYFTKRIF